MDLDKLSGIVDHVNKKFSDQGLVVEFVDEVEDLLPQMNLVADLGIFAFVLEVVEEESAKDKTFKEFADSYYSFRKQYKIWGEAQSLKPTYLK